MPNKASTNFVLHARSNQFYWEGSGQLSIKTFSNGNAHYKTNRGYFAVEEDRYLLLNEGEYTISIDEKREVESFCIFFKQGFAEEVLASLKESNDRLLSDPLIKVESSIGFFEKTYQFSKALSLQMTRLKNNMSIHLNHDEHFHLLMQTLLIGHAHSWRELESLQALRLSTREELYRRISIAHEYIRSYYNTPITLNDIAQIACLSPNHLLRTYSQIFGKTPHQHISEFRIQKAKNLLQQLSHNMTDITFEIGLQNPVSFSKLFRQHVGISPLEYRKKVILDKK